MADFFSGITDLKRIHKWYLDLADYIERITGGDSTAAKLLRYYLSPKEQVTDRTINERCINILEDEKNSASGTFILSSSYIEKIKDNSNYYSVLKKEYIPIFFSEKYKDKGILKRVKEDSQKTTFEMHWAQSLGFPSLETYTILKELDKYFDSSDINIVPINRQNKLDVFVGLHNYTVDAEIKMSLNPKDFYDIRTSANNDIRIKNYLGSIISWKSLFIDYYNFNKEVGFTLPNPDFTGDRSSKGKIHPELKKVRFDELKHSALVEMPQAGLAAPFYIYGESEEKNESLLIKNKEIRT